MIAKLCALIVKWRWLVVAIWVTAAVAAFIFAPAISSIYSDDQSSFVPKSYELARANAADKKLPVDDFKAPMAVVFATKQATPLTDADQATITGLVRQLNDLHIAQVKSIDTSTQLLASDKTTQLATVTFSGSDTDKATIAAVATIRNNVARVTANTNFSAGVTNGVAITYDARASVKHISIIVGIAAVVLVILLPALLLRSAVAGLLSVLIFAIVYLLSNALIAITGHVFNIKISHQLSSLYIMVLAGVGLTYVIFLLVKYQKQLRTGDHTRQAVAVALQRASAAIVTASLLVIAICVGLFFVDFGRYMSLVPVLVIVLLVTLLAILTLLPALLAIIGPKIFWPSKAWMNPASELVATRKTGVKIVTIVVIVVSFLCLAASYKIDATAVLRHAKNTPSAEAYNSFRAAFAKGVFGATKIYVASTTPPKIEQLNNISVKLKSANGVDTVIPTYIAKDQLTHQFMIVLKSNPYSGIAVSDVSGQITNAAHGFNSKDTQVYIGGTTAGIITAQKLTEQALRVLLIAAGVVMCLLLVILRRRLLAPLVFMVCLGLGYIASLGVTILVFKNSLDNPGLLQFISVVLYTFLVLIAINYATLMLVDIKTKERD